MAVFESVARRLEEGAIPCLACQIKEDRTVFFRRHDTGEGYEFRCEECGLEYGECHALAHVARLFGPGLAGRVFAAIMKQRSAGGTSYKPAELRQALLREPDGPGLVLGLVYGRDSLIGCGGMFVRGGEIVLTLPLETAVSVIRETIANKGQPSESAVRASLVSEPPFIKTAVWREMIA